MTPFTPAQAGRIRSPADSWGTLRDPALLNSALDTTLRASDLLPLRVIDLTDQNGGAVHEFIMKQKKTGRGHLVALSPHTRNSIADGMIASESIKKSGVTLPLETLDTIRGRRPLIHHLTHGYASATINEPLWGSTAFAVS